jgi:hypothetical protein
LCVCVCVCIRVCIWIFETGSHELFAWAGYEPQFS